MERLDRLFERHTGRKAIEIKELASSGSNRRYFRLRGGNISVVGVIGTSRKENEAFIALSRHFRGKGIDVPAVLGVDDDGMAYIQEDLGDLSLYDAVSSGRETGTYSSEEEELLCRTISKLPGIQFDGARGLDWSVCFPEPEFNERMVLFDLNYFKYCFLKPSGLDFDEVRLQDDFETMATRLVEGVGETFLYRDFQARNVILKDGEPFFIDFQGGRRGPLQYDLASFVYQARARYPEALRRKLVETYIDALEAYAEVDRHRFEERLSLFAVFRTLQVLGAYGFRGNFERKQHFLSSIPCAIDNLRDLLPFEPAPYLSDVLERLVSMSWPTGQSGGQRPALLATGPTLEVEVLSFSFKKGLPVDSSGNGGGYVFDCRAVNNPGRYEIYRRLTGLDPEVAAFLEEDGGIEAFLANVFPLVDSHVRCFLERGFTHLQVGFGCTGGQHRSVYSAERLAGHLASEFDVKVRLIHRELGIERVLVGDTAAKLLGKTTA